MKTYIGTKIVNAEPMTKQEYTEKVLELGSSAVDMPGYKVIYEDGYVSWSPKEVFERCYRELSKAEVKVVVAQHILGAK